MPANADGTPRILDTVMAEFGYERPYPPKFERMVEMAAALQRAKLREVMADYVPLGRDLVDELAELLLLMTRNAVIPPIRAANILRRVNDAIRHAKGE